MTQPECARCGGTEGELSYNVKKANRGIRIHLTACEDYNDVYYCSGKCLNIIMVSQRRSWVGRATLCWGAPVTPDHPQVHL